MPQNPSQIARSMMHAQRNQLAWPTLAASFALIMLFMIAISGYFLKLWPIWAASPIVFITIHLSFAVAHEATHKTISNSAKFAWIDMLLGTIHSWLLLYDFPTFKFLHLRHHANTNDPDLDPDYWLQDKSIPTALLLGLFTPLHYLHMFVIAVCHRAIAPRMAFFSFCRIGILIIILLSLLIIAPVETFFLWLAPASIASSIISVSHRMLHTIEQTPDRKKTTLIVRGERVWEWIINPFFWLNNHHFLHHEYPKLPCYTHEKLFAQSKAELIKSGVKIRTFGMRHSPRKPKSG